MTIKRIFKRRLFFDIETSPNVGIFWRAGFKQTITPDSILGERSIICICYKWQGEKKVHYLTWNKFKCDKAMLKAFVKVANSADEIVGHNGDRYDLSFIRTRCLFHKIPMFPNYVTLDTLKLARSKFMFNSNKLDYIGQFLGEGKKIATGGLSLWKSILLNNCPVAMGKMVKYCQQDVNLLERVFIRLQPHFLPRTHYGVKNGGIKSDCPECGSDDLKIAQRRVTASGINKVQLQCKSCGQYHTVPERLVSK
jgi:hypothetical protein